MRLVLRRVSTHSYCMILSVKCGAPVLTSMNMKVYTTCWVTFCLFAVAIMINDRKQLRTEWQQYFQFLCAPWKLAIFIPAFIFVTFAGRFTDDETWDIATGGVMSLLTFITAPWTLGLVYQVLKGKKSPRYLVVAVALCLFSTSWFYDTYLLLRDGHYSTRWLGNLMLSPIIYICGGLLWNLEAKNRFFAGFSFLREDWPLPPQDKSILPLLPIALPLVAVAGSMLISYVRWHF